MGKIKTRINEVLKQIKDEWGHGNKLKILEIQKRKEYDMAFIFYRIRTKGKKDTYKETLRCRAVSLSGQQGGWDTICYTSGKKKGKKK